MKRKLLGVSLGLLVLVGLCVTWIATDEVRLSRSYVGMTSSAVATLLGTPDLESPRPMEPFWRIGECRKILANPRCVVYQRTLRYSLLLYLDESDRVICQTRAFFHTDS